MMADTTAQVAGNVAEHVAGQVDSFVEIPVAYHILYFPIDIIHNIIKFDDDNGVILRSLNKELKNKVDSLMSIRYELEEVVQVDATANFSGFIKSVSFKSRPFERLSVFFARVNVEGKKYKLRVIRYGSGLVVGEKFDVEFDEITFINFKDQVERKFELVTKSIRYIDCNQSPAIFPNSKSQKRLFCDNCCIDNQSFFQGLKFKVAYTGVGVSRIEHPYLSFNACSINVETFGSSIEFGQFGFVNCQIEERTFGTLFESKLVHCLEISEMDIPRQFPEMTLYLLNINYREVLPQDKYALYQKGIDITRIKFLYSFKEVNNVLQKELSQSQDEDDKKMINYLKFVDTNEMDVEFN